jgi:hypothetical protein
MIINTVEIHSSEEITINKRYKNNFGKFQAIGEINCMYTKDKEKKTDIFNIIAQMSKPAIILFNELKNNRAPETNITTYSTKIMTNREKALHRLRIRELKKFNLIKKIKTYNRFEPIPADSWIINPAFIKCSEYTNAIKVYGGLK